MEREGPTRTNQARHGTQSGEGIWKKLENETTHRCIEGFVIGDLVHIGLGEGHIVQTCLGHASPGLSDGADVALYAHYLSRGTNQLGD